LFTPNFASKEEYEKGLSCGVWVTVDNIYSLEKWSDIFKDKEIFLRIDPGKGQGHHKYVQTAGKSSKFGISSNDMKHVSELAEKIGVKVVGLHAHLGSGILTPDSWKNTANFLDSLKDFFKDLKYMDLGGGLGIVEKKGQHALDLNLINQLLAEFKESQSRKFELWLEPGRYLVATAGILLAQVTQLKQKDDKFFIGINTGFNSLIRPVLYNAFHNIVNLSKYDKPKTVVAEVVGNICESGDVFGHDRYLPETFEHDVILISTTGAYGHAMSSHYNMRNPAREIILKNK